MVKNDRLITLKEAVMYSNHAEENIRLQIERGSLKKYDKNGIPIRNPLSRRGFFRLSELMEVYNIKDPEKIKEEFINRKSRFNGFKNIIPYKINVLTSNQMDRLADFENNVIDTWILSLKINFDEKLYPTAISYISQNYLQKIYKFLDESNRIIAKNGNIIIQTIPRYLPYFGVYLKKLGWYFKYWIVYPTKTHSKLSIKRFTPEANGILFFVKSKNNFRINKVRTPYKTCSFCSRPLKDYGGKKHLRHKEGMIVSDVWHLDDIPIIEPDSFSCHSNVLRRLIDLSCNKKSALLLAPYDGELPNELHK